MEQKFIHINDKQLPVVNLDGVNYYPINFVIEKVLMKAGGQIKLLTKKYNIVKLQIKFGEKNIQLSNCVDEESLKQILENSQNNRMNVNQLNINNELRSELGMGLLKSQFSNKPSDEELSEYSLWEQECISMDGLSNPDAQWKNCSVCHRYFPMTDMFYAKDPKNKINQRTECKCCMSIDAHFSHPDKNLDNINSKFGYEVYIIYRDHDVIKIYEHWILTKYCGHTPQIIHNEGDYLIISKYLVDKYAIKQDDINIATIEDISLLPSFSHIITQESLFKHLFKDVKYDPYNYPWMFKSYKNTDRTIEHAISVIRNYIQYNNIEINDIYNFNYRELIDKARVHGIFQNNLLVLAMEFHDNKYAAYRFNIRGVDYWKDKNNRIQALKYFIEEDMKIQLEKIPLYLTLTSLRNFSKTTTMYTVCKKYYKSLFEWVNEVYPDKFDPKDFDINYFRNEFDSVEESQVHDMLKNNLKNVLYNPRNTDRTVKIGGMIPDWIVITDKNMYVIEYFGITKEETTYNSRTEMYKKKMANKLEVYEKITYCKFIYLYPYDMVDNFKGILDKIKPIIIEQS